MLGGAGFTSAGGGIIMLEQIKDLKEKGDFGAISRLILYAGVIGLECDVKDGAMVTRLKPLESNVGNYQMGVLHESTVAALLEHAAKFQLLYEMDVLALPCIINIYVDYLRPSKVADAFTSAILVKQGKRIANVRIQAWQGELAKFVAMAHAHF
jgi:acyl-coenzyme A thioesterase PaaI-like protein